LFCREVTTKKFPENRGPIVVVWKGGLIKALAVIAYVYNTKIYTVLQPSAVKLHRTETKLAAEFHSARDAPVVQMSVLHSATLRSDPRPT